MVLPAVYSGETAGQRLVYSLGKKAWSQALFSWFHETESELACEALALARHGCLASAITENISEASLETRGRGWLELTARVPPIWLKIYVTHDTTTIPMTNLFSVAFSCANPASCSRCSLAIDMCEPADKAANRLPHCGCNLVASFGLVPNGTSEKMCDLVG